MSINTTSSVNSHLSPLDCIIHRLDSVGGATYVRPSYKQTVAHCLHQPQQTYIKNIL